MSPKRYDLPSAKTRELNKRIKELERFLELLLNDCSGKDVIAALDAKVSSLESVIEALSNELSSSKSKNANLLEKNKELKKCNAAYKKEIARLKLDVKVSYSLYEELERKYTKTEAKRFEWAQLARKLEEELKVAKAEIRQLNTRISRSPQNSSLPPSLSPNKKKICNSREKTGRKAGGQPGHVGHLRKWHKPDSTVILDVPDKCPHCGDVLLPSGKISTRQVSDLQIKVFTTEYVSEQHCCCNCGRSVVSEFPEEALNEANYGNNIRAVLTYLINTCNVSRENACGFLYEATGHELSVSKGSAHNFLRDFVSAAKGPLLDIADAAKKSPVLGSDATHVRSEGHQSYVYTTNSEDSVLFSASECKGTKPLLASILKDYSGIVLSDHDLSYYHFGTSNAECNVHVLRYLKGVMQNEPEKTWALKMYALLNEANALVKKCKAANMSKVSAKDLAEIHNRYDEIIALAKSEYVADMKLPAKYRPEGIALAARLEKYKDNHLAFLSNFDIPFDNNRSERHLRCIKKKLKQTGGFRSTENGLAPYCDYQSVTQTARLRDLPPLSVVHDIFNGKCTMFDIKDNRASASLP